jgi:DNA-binding CsgD family transcriptional regulator
MAEALCIHRNGDRRPLHVWAVPLLRASSGLLVPASEADVMVIVIDPELSMAPPIDALKALYGLTDAEARLTKGLLHGERLEDYAARAGISMNTARTHLKSVFAKTDTDRQAELMRLLSRTLCGS